jgi:hypothetical protein
MREPRFTETKRLGIVVRDLDATMFLAPCDDDGRPGDLGAWRVRLFTLYQSM